jgi:hypothetical protein
VANSLLQAFVTGTRALLSAQLIVSVAAVALAGWTLGVTNQLIRERDSLQERVIQLEETMAARGDIPPPPTGVVEPGQTVDTDMVYPESLANAMTPESAGRETSSTIVAQAPPRAERDIGSIVASLFGPAPPLRTIVLHVRGRDDADDAMRIAQELQGNGMRALIQVARAGDRRQPGYVYFDGRQSRLAANAVARFHEIARDLQIAHWSAQLRGTALPARGEYTADRLDLVLPPLPAPPPPPPPTAVAAPTP